MSSSARIDECVPPLDSRPPPRAPPRSGEPLARSLSELGVGPTELHLVPRRLLEVVAEYLVQLDEVGPALLEPDGEPLVQLGASGLRERVVGGVPDQEVAEAEGVVAGQLRPCRGA